VGSEDVAECKSEDAWDVARGGGGGGDGAETCRHGPRLDLLLTCRAGLFLACEKLAAMCYGVVCLLFWC
jgi:hypothetical protein